MFSTEIIVPTVIVVASVGGYLIYRRYQSMWEPPKGPLVVPVRVITLEQLREFDGSNGKDCYVAVKGVVFDVTRNLASYGPGAGYSNLAAKDASFALGKSSLKLEDCHWDYSTLSEKEMGTLDQWSAFFQKKYKAIARTNKYVEPPKTE